MTVIKHETGIELVPENEFERECLNHIANKPVAAQWTDSWERKGNLKLEFPKHEWDR